MSEAQRSGFVVKAVSLTGHAMWVSVPQDDGHRVFGPREQAEIFKTRTEAHSAIGKVPLAFEHAGLAFAVESSD
jgi:hypothetical protein